MTFQFDPISNVWTTNRVALICDPCHENGLNCFQSCCAADQLVNSNGQCVPTTKEIPIFDPPDSWKKKPYWFYLQKFSVDIRKNQKEWDKYKR